MIRILLNQAFSVTTLALIAGGFGLVGCGAEIPEQIQAIKNCEVVVRANEKRCDRRELPEAVSFSSERRYFQSRDVVYLAIDDELIDYGQFFSVINSSTGIVLIDDEPIPHQPTEFEGFSLFEDARVKVRIHPGMNPDYYLWGGVENHLRVVSRRGRNGDFRYNVSKIQLLDFEWFDANPRMASYPEAENFADYKAELWISEQAQPTVYSSDMAVTVGGYSAINPVY